MAAQARSLGFCLIFAAQDLPAMQKRVKEEARSITANCNMKIFGKLEDPTDTKDFFEKTIGQAMVMEASSFQLSGGSSTGSYFDTQQAGMQLRARASYDELKDLKEGEAVVTFGQLVKGTKIFYSNPGHAKAMRVTRFVALPPPDQNMIRHADTMTKVRDLMVHKKWTAKKADVDVDTPEEIEAMAEYFGKAEDAEKTSVECGMVAIASVYALSNEVDMSDTGAATGKTGGGAAQPAAAAPQAKAPTFTKPADNKAPPKAPSDSSPSDSSTTPEEKAKTPPAAKDQEAKDIGEKDAGENPFTGFSKKDDTAATPPADNTAQPAQTPPPQQPAQDTPPDKAEDPKSSVNWEELMKKNPSEEGEAQDSQDSEDPLDPEARDIMKRAGQTFRNSLFRKDDGKPPEDPKGDEDGAQAAE